MSLPIDRSQIIGIFSAEADEHLDALNQGVLQLEKNPEATGIIDEMFRSAHSLKGAAATVGFNDIRDVAHEMEDTFVLIRDQKIPFDSSVANQIFEKLDTIKELLREVIGREEALEKSSKTPQKEVPQKQKAAGKSKQTVSRKATQKSSKKEKDGNRRESGKTNAPVEEYIRVPLRRINTLLNLGGELIINKVKSTHKIASFRKAIKDSRSLQKRLASFSEQVKGLEDQEALSNIMSLLHLCNREAENIRGEVESVFEDIQAESLHVDPIIEELQQHIKEIRMLPCSTLFASFPRLVRDIAQAQEKEVEFRIEGEETELDKKVLEGLKEPLIHILRNSIDHGIETPGEREALGKPRNGTICLTAYHQGANVVIEVRDDGKGLDPDRIREVALTKELVTEEEFERFSERDILNLVFTAGFTTTDFITDVSGRGIGMDVVRNSIEGLKGRVEISSEKNIGTTIHMELPLTIAIIQILLLRSGGRTFGMPLSAVEEMVRLSTQEIHTVKNKMAFELRGHTVPLVRLDDTLRIPSVAAVKESENGLVNIVIIESLSGRIGFAVDELLGREEVYIKSFGSHLGKLGNVSGATVLGTGEIIVILDPADLVVASKVAISASPVKKLVGETDQPRKTLLVVEDSMTTRELMRSILEGEGYVVDTAMDGLDGMEKVGQKSYDLIVSDLEMPRMNGLELCRSLKANETYKDIPFIFVTARESEEEKRQGIEVGAQAYITKGSFNQKNLLNTISRLV